MFFTLTLPLWLTYYLGQAHCPFPEAACHAAAAAYYEFTYAAVALAAFITLCLCGSERQPEHRAAARLVLHGRAPPVPPRGSPARRRLSLPGAQPGAPRSGLCHRGLLRGHLPAGARGLREPGAGARGALGPGPGRSAPARPGPLCWGSCSSSPSVWRPTTCCWRPAWPGRRAPPAATRAVPGRLLHARRPAYTQPGAAEPKQLPGPPGLLLFVRALLPLLPLGPLAAELPPGGGGPGRMGPPLPLSRNILAFTPALPLPT